MEGGGYIERPGTAGPLAAWWLYEDHMYSLKRMIAAAGYPADEITLTSITYDEMRPGCYHPAARLADMDQNGVEAQLAFPNYPLFCGQLFMRGKDRDDHSIRKIARGNAIDLLGLELSPGDR